MEFRKVLALRGPNVWANSPVMEVWVDLKDLDRPSTDFPGFNERLMSWLPRHDRARMQHRRAWRVFSKAAGRDLSRTYPRARYPGIAVTCRPGSRIRAHARDLGARRLSHGLQVPRRATGAGNACMRRGSSSWRRSTIGPMTSRPRSSGCGTLPIRSASDQAPVRSSTRRKPAAFPCGG